MARLKRTGTKGLPCCSPVADGMMESPKNRRDKQARQRNKQLKLLLHDMKEAVTPDTIELIFYIQNLTLLYSGTPK